MNDDVLVNKLVPTLYEDDILLAVCKPAGVDTGGATGKVGAGLVEMLADVRGSGEKLLPINRLTRYESGVLLIGKNPAIVTDIRSRLRLMRIVQEYVGVVVGQMREPRLTIDSTSRGVEGVGTRLPRTPAQIRGSRLKRSRKTKPPSALRVERGRKEEGNVTGPRTTLRLIQPGKHRALVRCRTSVNNTHTLRAQLRSVRLRLLGDTLHDRSRRVDRPEQTCLHLERIAFHHPAAKAKINVTCKAPGVFKAVTDGQREVERALHAALTRRLRCLVEPDTDSYRLLTGDAEGVRGLTAEKYGRLVILQVHGESPAVRQSLVVVARWYRRMVGAGAVYAKLPAKGRAASDDQVGRSDRGARIPVRPSNHDLPRPLLGQPVPEQFVVTERGLRFAIRPFEGLSVGLFLDHRENRTRVRSMAEGKDVLNLFAYTCGFSVAAGAGGAKSTVSVDISSKYLEWGQANFELNGLDLTDHRFFTADAADFLKRAKRQDMQFDLILLDPPTFAHGRKRKQDFSITRDLADLVAASMTLLRPDGVLMVSTSYRRLSMAGLRERIKEGAGGRKYKVLETPRLPVDFAADPDHAKTIFIRVTGTQSPCAMPHH